MALLLADAQALQKSLEDISTAGLSGWDRVFFSKWLKWQRNIINGNAVPSEMIILSDNGRSLAGLDTSSELVVEFKGTYDNEASPGDIGDAGYNPFNRVQ